MMQPTSRYLAAGPWRLHLVGASVTLCLLWLLFTSSGTKLPSLSLPDSRKLWRNPEGKRSAVWNQTLGFQKAYAIVMPGRSDRRDALLGAAAVTNLTFEVVDGVVGEDVKDNEKPKNWKIDTHHWAGMLGCLVAHTNIWKKMIAEDIASALIIESDADWDMRIKHSAQGLSEGVRKIVDFKSWPELHQIGPPSSSHPSRASRDFSSTVSSRSSDPWGPGWDLIYIGTCGAKLQHDARVYAYNDSAASPPNHTSGFNGWPEADEYPREGTTRFVFQPSSAGCTVGYAISLKGAKHLLHAYVEETDTAIDILMNEACQHTDTTCLANYPPIVAQAASRSNMWHETPSADGQEKIEAGHSIQISARVNGAPGAPGTLGMPEEEWIKEWRD